ncbi:tRNA-U20a,U20b-dihydrouridine synthase [Oscillibacter sp. PC13]|uniref:tRNA dihydrouridine synthase n=1 Tax=Oscillibacter sp. PC13 TaxID=1855299 RepID=UPI0008E5E4C1|nr:tRNA-dihydrouridine synthase family protein [Oscillibacter sp. PC13]SFQ09080.1 tRNA-U20a,U20b-dihydrouridine synthase [Oscillibacter sp. PC13]
MSLRYAAAPLEGITTFVFRNAHHRVFGGVDRYFLPFFSPAAEHILTNRELRDLDPANNTVPNLVPQVMTRRAEDFLWAAEQVRAMGYREVNLNLGCPSGTVVAKGKGAGFLGHLEELDQFLDEVFSKAAVPVSVKTRLGIRNPEEFHRILEIFNRYPIAELTVHPRVQKEFYKGALHRDLFAWAMSESRNPLCYNGDLVTVEDCFTLKAEFPKVESVMIGRGLAADPALLRKLRGGSAATRGEVECFVQMLYEGYCVAYGQAGPAAQRMKELWFYLIHLFRGGEKQAKAMRRLKQPREYEQLEASIFRDLELREAVLGPLV